MGRVTWVYITFLVWSKLRSWSHLWNFDCITISAYIYSGTLPYVSLKSSDLWYCGHFVLFRMYCPLYSVKQTSSLVPTIPELYKIYLIIWRLIYRFHKIVHCIRWIQRLDIILALMLIVLTFSTLYGNRKVQKCGLVMLTSVVHITTPTRSIPEAPEIQIPPYYRHTVVPCNRVRFRGAGLLLELIKLHRGDGG